MSGVLKCIDGEGFWSIIKKISYGKFNKKIKFLFALIIGFSLQSYIHSSL